MATDANNVARWDDEGRVLIRVARVILWMWRRVARAANDRRRLLLLSTKYQVLPPDKRLTTNEHQEQHVESKTILVQGFLGGHHLCLQGDNPGTYQLDHTPAESPILQTAVPQCRAASGRAALDHIQ